MRIRRLTLLAGLLVAMSPIAFAARGSASPVPSGFVYAQGAQLMLNGLPYQFKGFNVYNANSRAGSCWYAMPDPVLSRNLAAMGSGTDVIRAWFFQDEVYRTSQSGAQWAPFDQTLRDAAAAGMKVIVTLGEQWGTCEKPDRQYKTVSWYRSGYRTEPMPREPYRAWVQQVVTRYRNNPNVLMWQLMNEAEAKTVVRGRLICDEPAAVGALTSWAGDMAHMIKSIDPYHLLSVGTLGGSQCGINGNDYQRVNAVSGVDLCEYHDYGDPDNPFPGSATNGLARRMTQCMQNLGKPLFIGESGIAADHAVVYTPDEPLETIAGMQNCAESQEQLGGKCPIDGVACAAPVQTSCRAIDFQYKLQDELAAGVAGVLVWGWCDPTMSRACGVPSHDDVVPGDPTVDVLRALA